MSEKTDVFTARMERVAGLFDQLRLKRHLMGQDGRDLVERLERRLSETEHRLGRGSAYRAGMGRVLHQTHEALRRLRERSSVGEDLS